MNSACLDNKNYVNSVGVFNDSAATNSMFGEIIWGWIVLLENIIETNSNSYT